MADGFSAADLRAQVEKVHESKGTIITFEYQTNPEERDQEPHTLTYVAISDGDRWGITNTTGGSDYISRHASHADLVKFLARPEVLSATVLVPGEAFKP